MSPEWCQAITHKISSCEILQELHLLLFCCTYIRLQLSSMVVTSFSSITRKKIFLLSPSNHNPPFWKGVTWLFRHDDMQTEKSVIIRLLWYTSMSTGWYIKDFLKLRCFHYSFSMGFFWTILGVMETQLTKVSALMISLTTPSPVPPTPIVWFTVFEERSAPKM